MKVSNLERARQFVVDIIDDEIIDLQIVKAMIKAATSTDKLVHEVSKIRRVKDEFDSTYQEGEE